MDNVPIVQPNLSQLLKILGFRNQFFRDLESSLSRLARSAGESKMGMSIWRLWSLNFSNAFYTCQSRSNFIGDLCITNVQTQHAFGFGHWLLLRLWHRLNEAPGEIRD